MSIGKKDEFQEFKEGLGQLDKGLKSLTAMLNRNGKGIVYFGVDDNGKVIGLTIGRKTLVDIRNRIRDLISPQIVCNIEECITEDNKKYIKISAEGNNIPYSCDGRYYIRITSSDEIASNEILRKMLTSSEMDIIKQISSINQELTFKDLINKLNENSIHAMETEQFYKNYELKNKDHQFNLMAFLLSDQNTMSIDVVKFEGINRSTFSERKEYTNQCLITTVNEILQYFKIINVSKVDLSHGERIETPLFNYEAFREAFVNACLHNSWAERLSPALHIFDDRIEIISYGGIPYSLTKECFYNGTSVPVNKSLFNIFLLAHLAENTGHGIPIIVSSYGKEAFNFDNDMIKVTINFNYIPDYVLGRKFKENSFNLSENQKNILDIIKNNKYVTTKEISEKIGLSLTSVKNIISKLQEINILSREGSKKKGTWIINNII